VPWMEANSISIHYELAGRGPSLVLLHEMGGTLASWDGIAPALSKRFHTGQGFPKKCAIRLRRSFWSRTSKRCCGRASSRRPITS